MAPRRRLSHAEGFELEERFDRAFALARAEGVSREAFGQIVNILAREQYRGVYKRRRCNRRLLYVGIKGHPPSKEYEIGKVYASTSFTGATYKIKGHGIIGSAYFRRLD